MGEDSIILQWEPSQGGHEIYIQITSVSDPSEIMKLFIKDAKRFKIDNLISGMTYDIGVATVINGNLSELVTIQQTLSENQILFIFMRYLLIWGYYKIFPDIYPSSSRLHLFRQIFGVLYLMLILKLEAVYISFFLKMLHSYLKAVLFCH